MLISADMSLDIYIYIYKFLGASWTFITCSSTSRRDLLSPLYVVLFFKGYGDGVHCRHHLLVNVFVSTRHFGRDMPHYRKSPSCQWLPFQKRKSELRGIICSLLGIINKGIPYYCHWCLGICSITISTCSLCALAASSRLCSCSMSWPISRKGHESYRVIQGVEFVLKSRCHVKTFTCSAIYCNICFPRAKSM